MLHISNYICYAHTIVNILYPWKLSRTCLQSLEADMTHGPDPQYALWIHAWGSSLQRRDPWNHIYVQVFKKHKILLLMQTGPIANTFLKAKDKTLGSDIIMFTESHSEKVCVWFLHIISHKPE